MDFGKLTDISNVDFSFPNIPLATKTVLQNTPQAKPAKIYAGCPIWANADWIGTTYPIGIKERDYLKFYAEQFNTIELNVTHYQIPLASTVKRWRKSVKEGFLFAPKFPQTISHQLLAEGNAKAKTEEFCAVIANLEDNLGTCFLQLPPHFMPKQVERLEQFLDELPLGFDLAIEFRHADWFKEDNFEKIAKILEYRKIGTVLTDVSGRRDVLHLRLTTKMLMLRFVGNDLHQTDYARVDAWVDLMADWLKMGLEEIYFFAHEPDNIHSPVLVKYFLQKFHQNTKIAIQEPKFYQKVVQGSLF